MCVGGETCGRIQCKSEGHSVIETSSYDNVLKEILIIPAAGSINHILKIESSVGFVHARKIDGPYWISIGPYAYLGSDTRFDVWLDPPVDFEVYAKFAKMV